MSTSKKKTIKFTALMTVLLLTVTYFSLLTPTSAYFYQKFDFENNGITFSLLDFEVTDNTVENGIFEENYDLEFEGATKFADFDEKLFDEVAIVKEFTVKNAENGVPAKVIPRVHLYDNAGEKGLKYMIFTPDSEPETVAEENSGDEPVVEKVTLPKGELKSDIERILNLFPGEATSVDYSSAVSALDKHNDESNHIVELAPGESVDVKIVFWAEYDAIISTLDENKVVVDGVTLSGEEAWQDAESVTSVSYKCSIEFVASQLSTNDEAVTTALAEEAPTWKETTTVNQ